LTSFSSDRLESFGFKLISAIASIGEKNDNGGWQGLQEGQREGCWKVLRSGRKDR